MTATRNEAPRFTRIGVLASGGGSNLGALLAYFNTAGNPQGRVCWVGSNRADAGALTRAREMDVAADVLADPADGEALLRRLAEQQVDLLVLAGYLKLVPSRVIEAFAGRILNVHPALLPAFGGNGMYGARVHEAVLAHGVRITGVTVHFVSAEYDRGAIAAQWPVAVQDADTATSLAARVLLVEHQLLPRTVEAVASGQLTLGTDGKVHGTLAFPALPLPLAVSSSPLHSIPGS